MVKSQNEKKKKNMGLRQRDLVLNSFTSCALLFIQQLYIEHLLCARPELYNRAW